MVQQGGEARLRMVCAGCSSEEVTRYGWAEWSIDLQEWRIGALFDSAFCHRCRGSTHIEPRPLAG
jgi:hypothetical protein